MSKRLTFGIIAIIVIGAIMFLVRGYLVPKAQAKPIPHPLAGREECLTCHGPGTQGAPTTDHPERSKCTICHEPAQ